MPVSAVKGGAGITHMAELKSHTFNIGDDQLKQTIRKSIILTERRQNMQEITEILKQFGLEIPNEKAKEFKKSFNENYKTVSEFNSKIKGLEGERDNYKQQLETANVTLEKFKDVDVEGLNEKIKTYETEIAEINRQHKEEIEKRDFSDALDKAIESYKFTSDSARNDIMNKISSAGLKLIDGQIIGLNDMMEKFKKEDAGAFVDKEQEELENNKARFTRPLSGSNGRNGKITPSELMKMKNENPDLDISQYMGKGE